MKKYISLLGMLAACWLSLPCLALPIVEKQVFRTTDFTLFSGQTLAEVQVGWESYGQLNANKDNVILITHHFSGSSHAAGRYHPDDAQPGYWDALIGPGKAIDTDKYFVISVDTLANLAAYDEHVVTTGPSSVNPATGKPYGLNFPVVTIRDFVNVQKQVLESLGIRSLHAVAGPSMGSMQALEWASAYPDWVERVVSVIGTGASDAWTTASLAHWAAPIRLDPAWQDGAYERDNGPHQGLTAALMLITQYALHPAVFNQQGQTLGYQPLEQAPLSDIRQSHSIVNWLQSRAQDRAKTMDANHLLYLVRACQLFVAGHGDNLRQGLSRVQAKTLFLPASTDLLLLPYLAKEAHSTLAELDKPSTYHELTGQYGHLEGLVNIQEAAQQLRAFLASEDSQ